MSERRRLSGTNVAVIVVALCAAVVLAPVGVMAATGTLVNITDPYNSAARARVDSGKLRVGDGNSALTVDGTVKTVDVHNNAVVYQAPAGFSCGASSSGLSLGTFDVSKYRALRISIESSVSNQTIIAGYARAGSQVILKSPVFDWTVPANTANHLIVENLPTKLDVTVWFCHQPKLFIYGLR